MTKRLTTNLRFGWTTGTCATAAVNAAYTAMVTGAFPERVSVITPGGKEADLEVALTDQGQDWSEVGIVKDAGDDPDVTHGVLVIARVATAAIGGDIYPRRWGWPDHQTGSANCCWRTGDQSGAAPDDG